MGAHRIASLASKIEQGLRRRAGEARIAALMVHCEAELAHLAEVVRTLPVTATK